MVWRGVGPCRSGLRRYHNSRNVKVPGPPITPDGWALELPERGAMGYVLFRGMLRVGPLVAQAAGIPPPPCVDRKLRHGRSRLWKVSGAVYAARNGHILCRRRPARSDGCGERSVGRSSYARRVQSGAASFDCGTSVGDISCIWQAGVLGENRQHDCTLVPVEDGVLRRSRSASEGVRHLKNSAIDARIVRSCEVVRDVVITIADANRPRGRLIELDARTKIEHEVE
jgi:hypothetical protein